MVALQRVSNDTRHLGRNENYRIKYPRIFYTFQYTMKIGIEIKLFILAVKIN